MSSESRRKLLTTVELAEHLQVRPETVRGWARSSLIPVVRVTPKVIRYDLDAVIRALTDRQETRHHG